MVGMQELQDGIAKAKDSNEEMTQVGREVVDFHGEMILLENYSALNYTGACLFSVSKVWSIQMHGILTKFKF